MTTSPKELLEDLELPTIVQLFNVTYNNFTYHFTNSLRQDDIYWAGNKYTSFPCAISNTGYTEDNISDTPKLIISNINGAFTNILASIPNLKGATLEYIGTFEPYINTTAANNNNLFFEKKHYIFAKLLSKTREQIAYELNTYLNWNNKKMPFRQILQQGKFNLRFPGAGLNKQRN